MTRGQQPLRREGKVKKLDVKAVVKDMMSLGFWDEAMGARMLHPGPYANLNPKVKGYT